MEQVSASEVNTLLQDGKIIDVRIKIQSLLILILELNNN